MTAVPRKIEMSDPKTAGVNFSNRRMKYRTNQPMTIPRDVAPTAGMTFCMSIS
jgi:hypothetical protein